MTQLQIIHYTDQHQQAFKELNSEWLERYGLMEPRDLETLDDPHGTILKHGGVIYLAESEGRIIGSAALMKEHEGVYELAKMSVAAEYRGKGISKLLLQKCLHKARELKAHKVTLFSNHQLKTAIALYEKFGFRHVPVEDSPFETADVKMELVL
jgi:putative acetyltransferase